MTIYRADGTVALCGRVRLAGTMSPLRITLAGYDDEPPLGGQGAVLAGMRSALRARGVEVLTLAGRGCHAIDFPAVVHRAPLDLSLLLSRRPQLLTAGGPELVHAHGGPGGLLLLRPPTVPLVYTAHHTYGQAYGRMRPQRVLAPLERRSYALAAMVLPVSASTAAAVREMGVAASRIEVMAPGIDAPAVMDERRRDPGRLLFAGRLEPEKGVLDAVAVMAQLIGRRPDISAAVVGTGSLEGSVRAAAAGSPRLEVLGAVDPATLADQYARASILLMPSRYEGLGLVALEAMAAGAAVVGYDVDGLRDAVGAGRGGLLVPAGRREELAEACVRLLDPGRRAELAGRGRAHVLAHHSWAVVGRRLEEIYRAVIAAGPRRRPPVD